MQQTFLAQLFRQFYESAKLTFNMPITTAAHKDLKYFHFSEKIRLDIDVNCLPSRQFT